MLFDSHAHINNDTLTDAKREALIKDIEASNLSYVMDVGFDLESSLKATKHAAGLPWCYAVVGVHPHDAKTMDEEVLLMIKGLTKKEKVQAIGEIGLDYYWDDSRKGDQKELFKAQLRMALELDKPVIVHDREAHEDSLKAVLAFPGLRGVFHCYSGSVEMARELLKRGWYLGFDGPITYKHARKALEVLEMCPMDRILIETDSPYLSPVPQRGKRNDSTNLQYIAAKLAEIKGISLEEAAKQTMENAKRLFGIK